MANSSNPNYTHACGGRLVPHDSESASLSSCYSPEEISELFRFYVLEAPIKAGQGGKSAGLRYLKDLGWKDKSLNQLEGKLLQASEMSSFIILGSTSITATLKAMRFTDQICIEHPRCVLQRPTNLTLQEDGRVNQNNCTLDKNRMQGLFRHLRNGFAHGCIRIFGNSAVLIEDFNETKGQSVQTAAILVKAQTLLDWIEIVETQGKDSTK